MNDAIKAYANLKRPFACIDMEALDWNISMVNRLTGDKKIRVATKSVRSVDLLRYIAERLPNHCGWMTYDCEETQFLLERGFNDLLIGYPQMEKEAIVLLIPYIANGSKVVFMVDSLEQISLLNRIGEGFDVKIEICMDINLSTDFKLLYFGTQRSSLKNMEDVRELIVKLSDYPFTEIVGVMGYEAQIAGVPDTPVAKWQKLLVRFLKHNSQKKLDTYRKDAVRKILEVCPDLSFVNGGGSGSIGFTSRAVEVTELTIGSAFYFPALFSRYDQAPFEPAMSFALRVTRKPGDDIAVCHGGGYVSSGAVSADKSPIPVWPKNLSLLKNEGAGEVQTPLLDKDRTLKIGDTVFFRHAKAGELCEQFNEIHARRGNRYVKTFKTYRGDGACFL